MSKQELIIDVDQIISAYNKENPEKKPMTRTSLAEIVGVNKQIFSDWKGGKTPKWVYVLIKLMNVVESFDVNQFIIPKNEEGGS